MAIPAECRRDNRAPGGVVREQGVGERRLREAAADVQPAEAAGRHLREAETVLPFEGLAREDGVRLTQKMQVSPCIPVRRYIVIKG